MRHLLALVAASSFLWIAGCTNAPEIDIGASTNAVCCGANCCCPSIGSGGAIAAGDINPDNMCESCDPATTASAWTPIPGCTAGTDAGTTGGTDAGPPADDGGGCSVSATAPGGSGLLALFGFAAAFVFSRRR